MASSLEERAASGEGEGAGVHKLADERAPAGMLAEVVADFADYKHRKGMRWLQVLASLRLTVALFAMAIFIVFVGTLAQTQHDIWYVVNNYFRTGIAWIDFQVFFPKSFFPGFPKVSGFFPFPGGWLIGSLMAVNLLAAHTVRFRAQARGGRLWAGLGVITLGGLVTALVILGGSGDGLQGEPFFSWRTLWALLKVTLAAVAALGVWGATQIDLSRLVLRRSVAGASLALAAFSGWLFVQGDAVALGDSSMRILWQLIQGTLAGGVLLAGCWLVFAKRAGIVLLHAGIGLMMFNELFVGKTAVEGQMHIREGDSSNFIQDIREVELAVVDRSNAATDSVVVIPQSRLDAGTKHLEHAWLSQPLLRALPIGVRRAVGATSDVAAISDRQLPFDVRVVRYVQNSDVRKVESGDDNPATVGLGLQMFAAETAAGVGASSSSRVDEPAVYVELLKKETGQSLGTYLLSRWQSRFQESYARSGFTLAEARSATGPFIARACEPVTVDVDGKRYDLALRFKRAYKPFTLKLLDVHTEYYPGTTTPRDYSSVVQLTDPTRDVDREVRIWMNNPLRFAGETFYQSSVGPDDVTQTETTGLQVVTNAGWMIPYVSCMIVAVGMLFQFGQTLLRFLHRRDAADIVLKWGAAAASPLALGAGLVLRGDRQNRDAARSDRRSTVAPAADGAAPRSRSFAERYLPLATVLLCALMVARAASPPSAPATGFDLYAAGQLPVVADGRAKPLDTLARNTLQVMSNKETLLGVMDAGSLKAAWPQIEEKLRQKWTGLDGIDLSQFAGRPEALGELARLIDEKTAATEQEAGNFIYKLTSKRQPAMRWLLDVFSGAPTAPYHRVFRIENTEVLDLFGLSRREGFLYSLSEITEKTRLAKFLSEVDRIRNKSRDSGADSLSVYERKLLELDRRTRAFMAVYRPMHHSNFPREVPAEALAMARSQRDAIRARLREDEATVRAAHAPLLVPVKQPPGPNLARNPRDSYEWTPYGAAWEADYFESKVFQEREPDPAVAGWEAILTAYRGNQSQEFNQAVQNYRNLTGREVLPDFNKSKVDYEAYFNHFAPFYQACILYVCGFVLTALGWLGWSRPLNRAAFWLGVFTLALHTFALASRIYISGRPPVTNLYSSAVFIGWGCVVLGLSLEMLFRLGLGNAISMIAGFATLVISSLLARDGDTFTVMQAVLDTQFWLATHVVCITLGYATTFLSGILGALYILRRLSLGLLDNLQGTSRSLDPQIGKDLSRMIYGTLCFAIFFSFVGTVLGGLWADDSWGRFWGWDPKENGALIIVLWNALVLHARWGAMVKDRGMAILAVGGNIVTSWSWFGVNELGVGLHSYGFTEGVLLALGSFVVSQLLIAVLGMVPKTWLGLPAQA